jgi:hypothetical protein
MFRNGVFFRVLGVLIVLGLIAAAGFMAFQAGEASGIAQAPAVATAISKAAENGQAVNVPPMMYNHPFGYGYGPGAMMYGRHHFGFFPGAFCFGILFLFLLLGGLRMIFFGRMHMMHHHGGHWHGPWGRKWEDGVPPMFNDWHKRAHGETPEDEKKSEE